MGANDLSDPEIAGLSQEDVSGSIDGGIAGGDAGVERRPAVSVIAAHAVTRQRRDGPVGSDHPESPSFHKVETPVIVAPDAADGVQTCGCSRSAVAGMARFAVTGHGGDEARTIDAPDPAVPGIGNIQIAVSIRPDGGRSPQPGRCRR